MLEAVWREALWLIKDGVATTEQIDDLMTHGFGLRWAQKGLFETYRTAGGEAGMKHFLEQFGPCLQWPWTKLTDVPDLDDALIDRIVEQSDAQAAGRSVSELEDERQRNCCIVRLQRCCAALTGGCCASSRWTPHRHSSSLVTAMSSSAWPSFRKATSILVRIT